LSRAGDLLAGALGSALVVLFLLSAMWVLEVLDYVVPLHLDRYGIIAHDPASLPGIFFAPFLHAGFAHLMANSLPLLILGFLAAIRGIGRFLAATVLIILISGIGVWLFSPPNLVTIGASGLVFGYFGYVVTRGLFDRHLLDILLGVVVAVLYYSILWGVLPTQPGISWQGHLFGLIGGFLSAWLLRRRRPEPRL
jgi:membrane associated rhomboid family serine protease